VHGIAGNEGILPAKPPSGLRQQSRAYRYVGHFLTLGEGNHCSALISYRVTPMGQTRVFMHNPPFVLNDYFT
jgi:hypothetical protein